VGEEVEYLVRSARESAPYRDKTFRRESRKRDRVEPPVGSFSEQLDFDALFKQHVLQERTVLHRRHQLSQAMGLESSAWPLALQTGLEVGCQVKPAPSSCLDWRKLGKKDPEFLHRLLESIETLKSPLPSLEIPSGVESAPGVAAEQDIELPIVSWYKDYKAGRIQFEVSFSVEVYCSCSSLKWIMLDIELF